MEDRDTYADAGPVVLTRPAIFSTASRRSPQFIYLLLFFFFWLKRDLIFTTLQQTFAAAHSASITLDSDNIGKIVKSCELADFLPQLRLSTRTSVTRGEVAGRKW